MIVDVCAASSWLSGPKPCGEMTCGFWAGWAVGGGRWVAPEQAGMPMGKGQGSARYVMLEVRRTHTHTRRPGRRRRRPAYDHFV